MRLAMLELMQALQEAAFRLEGVADELVAASNRVAGQPVAGVMRALARRHRVEALLLHGRHAILEAAYAEGFAADRPRWPETE